MPFWFILFATLKQVQTGILFLVDFRVIQHEFFLGGFFSFSRFSYSMFFNGIFERLQDEISPLEENYIFTSLSVQE